MKTSLRLLGLLTLAFTSCTSSLDLDVPRLYACDRADGLNSCPGGWRCGLSGFCQDPAQPLPYACESSEDCSPTWHCGIERLCYDRAAALDRSCRASLEAIPDGGDCAPGWRCGRELRGQVCHQLDAGAAYVCTSDSDCEAGWRCGTERSCVDVAAQALRAGEVTLSMEKVSPLLPGQVDLLQLRLYSETNMGQNNRVVFTADGRLTVATSNAALEESATSSRDSTVLLRPARSLAETAVHLLVTDSTGLMDYRDALGGGTPVLLVPAQANAELRYAPPLAPTGSAWGQEELAAFSGSNIWLCGRGTSSMYVCDPSSFQLSTLPVAVRDLVFLDEGPSSRRPALAATAAGPYFAPRAGSSYIALDGGSSPEPVWRAVALRGLSDACAPNPTPIDRLFYEDSDRLLAAISDQGRRLTVFSRTSSLQNNGVCDELAFDPEYGPCAACGPGEVLVKVGTQKTVFADPQVLTLCQRGALDAGSSTMVSYRHHPLDGGCRLETLALPPSVTSGYRVARETSGLQGVDSIGMPRECPNEGCGTMLYSRAPDRVAGGPALLGTYQDDVINENGHQKQPSSVSGPLGLQRVRYEAFHVVGSVTENPDWMIGSTGSAATFGDQAMVIQSLSRRLASQNMIPAFALLNRSSDLLPSVAAGGLGLQDATATRSFSTITTDAEGHPWIIIGAGDRIWADDARRITADAGVLRTIQIKTVPLPSSEIQSLAFSAFDRGDAGVGPLLNGYTVEQQRLFRVVVHTQALWLPEEIRLGVTSTVPISVWMDGTRGRVGTSDGRVFSLPVPVPLSTTIPEAPLPEVLNYGSLCGQAFALSSTALYRLSLETPPLGTWKRVSLESALPGLDSFAPHWGPVLHKARVGDQEHLYLFSHTGLVVKLEAACP